jgi:hypothetical protein
MTNGKKDSKEMIVGTVVGLAVVVVLVLSLRFFVGGPEGRWVCENGEWVGQGNPGGEPPVTGCEPTKREPAIVDPATVRTEDLSLDKARLRRDVPGMKPDTWYLHFDLPGGYTLFEVEFTEDAVCTYDGEMAPCDSLYPPSGAATSFSGKMEGTDVFLVSSLTVTPR